MKTELEKRIIVAEACGWKMITTINGNFMWRCPYQKPIETYVYDSPEKALNAAVNYNTIDSIRSAVMQQSEEFQEHFDSKLRKSWIRSKLIHQLTRSDWLDTFVETYNQINKK